MAEICASADSLIVEISASRALSSTLIDSSTPACSSRLEASSCERMASIRCVSASWASRATSSRACAACFSISTDCSSAEYAERAASSSSPISFSASDTVSSIVLTIASFAACSAFFFSSMAACSAFCCLSRALMYSSNAGASSMSPAKVACPLSVVRSSDSTSFLNSSLVSTMPRPIEPMASVSDLVRLSSCSDSV